MEEKDEKIYDHGVRFEWRHGETTQLAIPTNLKWGDNYKVQFVQGDAESYKYEIEVNKDRRYFYWVGIYNSSYDISADVIDVKELCLAHLCITE